MLNLPPSDDAAAVQMKQMASSPFEQIVRSVSHSRNESGWQPGPIREAPLVSAPQPDLPVGVSCLDNNRLARIARRPQPALDDGDCGSRMTKGRLVLRPIAWPEETSDPGQAFGLSAA